MAYQRKTRDEYDIEMLTSEGWEIVDCRETRKAAIASKKEYQQNQPGYEYRVKHHRVRIDSIL
jgi:hypothetical protein